MFLLLRGNILKVSLYYDEERDFLEFGIDKPSNGYFRDLGDEVFERVDEKQEKSIVLLFLILKKGQKN